MLVRVEEKHTKLKTQIENYFILAGISPDMNGESGELGHLLTTLSDQTRITRVYQIRDE